MFHTPAKTLRQAATLLLSLSAAVITACGGGGGGVAETTAPAATGSAATATAYAAGPITGFGSIIVNGVRYDDSTATVVDEDDAGKTRDALKLGMMVEVDGNQFDRANNLCKALRIRFGSAIIGPVTQVSSAAGTLVVLGQTVAVTDTTVFDDSFVGGLGGISVGAVIEVHAQLDAATGKYTATRIEPRADALTYKLRGVVANLDITGKTFTLGDALINYGGIAADQLPEALANGLMVRVRLQTAQVNAQWVAVSVRHGVRKIEDRADAQLRGTITAFTTTSDFEVNGLKVNAAQASFPDGTSGVVLGAAVEVEGKVVDGVLVAAKVELDARHAQERHVVELHGPIGALDTTAKTFKLRGVNVSYGGNVVFKDGSETDLKNGTAKLEVRGLLMADHSTVNATLIDFEH
jgi:hypothetical protein